MMKPEQTPARALPDGDALQKKLYGGLKGRIRNSLGALDNALETMADTLKSSLNPEEFGELQPMLNEMNNQLEQVRRLSEYTADAALGTALGQMYAPHLMDLLPILKVFCAVFNEEAPLAEHPAKMQLQTGDRELMPALGDEHLFGALLANLLSNAVAARNDCTITFVCNSSELSCHDDGPGMPTSAAALLTHDCWTPELVENGGVGLLLIRRNALAMGWKISVETPPEGGTTIRFALRPCAGAEGKTQLQSTGNGLGLEKRTRALLRRELAALPKPGRGSGSPK